MEEIIKKIEENKQRIKCRILKSFGIDIEKSIAVVGEIRQWKDGTYKKISSGKWVKLEDNKEKLVSNSKIIKIIESEINRIWGDYLQHKNNFAESIENNYPKGTFQYQNYLDMMWEKNKMFEKDFIQKLLKEKKDLHDELNEIYKIIYNEKKQKREKKSGKHEIDEIEINQIIKKYFDIFREIDNVAPLHVRAIELMPNVTINDYFLDTETNFNAIAYIKEDVDAISHIKLNIMWENMKSSGKYIFKQSPKSNSEYLIDENNGDIYRYSDHWGRVASCRWTLNDDWNRIAIAKSNLKDFNRRKDSVSVYFNPKHKELVLKTVKKTFPKIKSMLKENEKFYLTKKSEKILVDFASDIFKKYVNVNSFEINEIEKLRKKFEFI